MPNTLAIENEPAKLSSWSRMPVTRPTTKPRMVRRAHKDDHLIQADAGRGAQNSGSTPPSGSPSASCRSASRATRMRCTPASWATVTARERSHSARSRGAALADSAPCSPRRWRRAADARLQRGLRDLAEPRGQTNCPVPMRHGGRRWRARWRQRGAAASAHN